MNNLNNWLIAIIIIVLLGGGIWWVYNGQAENNNNPNPETTTNDNSDVQILSQAVSKDDWTIGPENAPIQLVAYEDYQCPACRALSLTFAGLVDEYPDQVSYTYRHFQLDGHPMALPAAQIAEAAGAQGKFWEMHNWLLTNDISSQANLDLAYDYAAGDLGLDADQMKSDVQSGKFLDKINAQKQTGIASNIPGTPTLFLNSAMLSWEDTTNIEEVVKNKLDTL
ncbi:MAG: thioredoxin domain-containing protein [Patescibacteria group bacterium]